MAISYEPGSRKWNVTPEQETFERKPLTENISFNVSGYYFNKLVSGGGRGQPLGYERVFVPQGWTSGGKGATQQPLGYQPATIKIDLSVTKDASEFSDWILQQALERELEDKKVETIVIGGNSTYPQISSLRSNVSATNKKEVENNTRATELNNQYEVLETENKAKNAAYNTVMSVVNSTNGGDYVQQRNLIRQIKGIDDQLKNTLEDYYKAYYSNEKIETWNSNLGASANPPYGEFDASYYESQNAPAAQQWANAVANDDIDITQRYGKNGFYLNHYITQGKAAGARGNKEEELTASKQYVEYKPTDTDLQQARTLQLGINIDNQTARLLKIPEVASAWEAAKAGDAYWESKGKEFLLNPKKADEFAVLFRMSDRPEDKEVSFKYNINAGYGITELEDVLNKAVGEKAIIDVKKFGALTQDVLKETVEKMKQAKAKEQELAMFSNFDAFGEIININKDLTNSILGDSGVGGILSFTGSGDQEKSLEKALQGISGINNEVIYNWQQWFDDTLKQRYQDDLEIGFTQEEASETVKVEGQFAREFIDQYLTPRFNEAKSMNEFIDYLDVKKTEQNPFQTQDMLNAVKMIADLKATQYIEELRKTPERYFNSEFYFNPTGDKAKEDTYLEQASTVAADWEAAKKGDSYWASQAYRFGVDVNDKDAFARMHFQVKGQGQGFDPAEDILTASKINDYIYTKILPSLNEEALRQGTVFGEFLKPEEFADEILQSIDPGNKEDWDEVLNKYDLDGFTGTVNELKDYISEALRTGSAQDIREQIKYLNEKKERPTQQNLGIMYIQREKDYTPAKTTAAESQLYKVFQSAGYQGSEDEFYEKFFPDVDRSEQIALTKAGTNQGLEMVGFDLSDPISSFNTVESFFNEESDEKEPTKSSYFTIDEDEEAPAKSSAGQGFLDEFTSMFKGLK